MTDPTPEERAAREALLALYLEVVDTIAMDVSDKVFAWVRAAVETAKKPLADEVERLRKMMSGKEAFRTELIRSQMEEIARLREALEKIATADQHEGDPDCDADRMMDFARAAREGKE